MRRVYMFPLFLLFLSVLSVPAVSEASVINMFPVYGVSGGACPDGFPSPTCVSVSAVSYSPIGFFQSFPPPINGITPFISMSASGGYGSVQSSVSVLFVHGAGSASTRIDFNVSDPSEIDMTCSASAFGFGMSSAGLTDVTTGQFLFGCAAAFDPVTASGSASLNTTDLYELTASSGQSSPDSTFATLNFSIPGVTAVNVFVPEPPAICLLGVALVPLGLLSRMRRKRR